MSQEANTAPGQESKEVQPKPETIGEAIKPKEETVPLAALIEMKKANKALAREMAELKKTIEGGASKTEVSDSIESIISEYSDIDPDFLKKFSSAVSAEARKKAQEEITEKLKPIQEREAEAHFEKVFSSNYESALETSPEYKDVANREVIKQLSLLPQNANKTFSQLIEETYKQAVVGKRSIDSASSRAGRESEGKIDMGRVDNDPSYFKEVQANPELLKQYKAAAFERTIRSL